MVRTPSGNFSDNKDQEPDGVPPEPIPPPRFSSGMDSLTFSRKFVVGRNEVARKLQAPRSARCAITEALGIWIRRFKRQFLAVSIPLAATLFPIPTA